MRDFLVRNGKFWWNILVKTFQNFSEDKGFKHGAAIAYYTIFSLPSILIIIIRLAGILLGEENVKNELLNQIEFIIGNQSKGEVARMIEGIQQDVHSFWATLLSLGTLIFAATGTFYTLQDSIHTMWKIDPKVKGSFFKLILDRLVSFAMVVTMGFILLVSMVLETIILAAKNFISKQFLTVTDFLHTKLPEYADFTPYLISLVNLIHIIDILFMLFVITSVFALLFKFLPHALVRWRDVWVGALFTSLLFTLGKYVLGWYLGSTDLTSTYGAAGDILLILLWVYYSSQIILIGAEFVYVYAEAKNHPITEAPFVNRITTWSVDQFTNAFNWLRKKLKLLSTSAENKN